MELHFPSPDDVSWESVEPADLGWNMERLQEGLSFARAHNSEQVVILEAGRLAVNDFTGAMDDMSDVFAVQKSLFAILMGIAVQRGLLQVNDPLKHFLPAGWTQLAPEEERKLTVRHLLTMTTGMDDQLYPHGEIGVTWRYNNPAYNYLKRILVELTGMSLQELTESWLLQPLGMQHTRWVNRDNQLPDGNFITGLEMSGLDMARLGLFVLAKGLWHSQPIIEDEHYWEMMLSPGSKANPAWCFLWWRNDQSHFQLPFRDKKYDGVPMPFAPRDMIMTQGWGDNRIYIIPSLQRVIVRRGGPAFKQGVLRRFDEEFWQYLSSIWAN
jgi:CubicO group peptidase (beta-lactamase class C family)